MGIPLDGRGYGKAHLCQPPGGELLVGQGYAANTLHALLGDNIGVRSAVKDGVPEWVILPLQLIRPVRYLDLLLGKQVDGIPCRHLLGGPNQVRG